VARSIALRRSEVSYGFLGTSKGVTHLYVLTIGVLQQVNNVF